MTNSLDDHIRQIIRDEVRSELGKQRANLRTTKDAIQGFPFPLRIGEVERQYSVSSAAEILEVSTSYIYDRLDDGELPRRLDLGGTKAKYRIPATDLQAFIDSRMSDSRE